MLDGHHSAHLQHEIHHHYAPYLWRRRHVKNHFMQAAGEPGPWCWSWPVKSFRMRKCVQCTCSCWETWLWVWVYVLKNSTLEFMVVLWYYVCVCCYLIKKALHWVHDVVIWKSYVILCVCMCFGGWGPRTQHGIYDAIFSSLGSNVFKLRMHMHPRQHIYIYIYIYIYIKEQI